MLSSTVQTQTPTTARTTLEIKVARVFKPLLGPNRYKGAHGGRGSGKSHFFAERVVRYCIQHQRARIVCVREVQRSLRESVKLLIEDKIQSLGVGPYFNILHDRIETPGGGVILFQGMQEHTKESIKSLENFMVAYVEEAQTMTAGSLEMLRPTIRAPGSELWFSWNPRAASDPVDLLLRGEVIPNNAAVVRANYRENPFFPEVLEDERAFDEQHTPTRYGHIWLGEYEPMAIGAIFNMQNINEQRRSKENLPDMKRIVVSIDPAGSAETGSNETGIVVCGVGEDGRGYVLDDLTLIGTPQQWAERAVAAYDLYEADAIVAEVNFGGDMVANTIRTTRPNLHVIQVRAHRGQSKHVRAEPISALYTLGKISHVGAFPKLEAQLCLITAAGYEGVGSPDRADAAVWAFSELFGKLTRRASGKSTPVKANNVYRPQRWRS